MPHTPARLYCRHDASGDPIGIGCRGQRVDTYAACLAHLSHANRDAYFSTLHPGSDIDHRGTTFDQSLITRLTDGLREPATGHPRIGSADFRKASFIGDAHFEAAAFEGEALFDATTFKGTAGFSSATFKCQVRFASSTFASEARFSSATFADRALFDEATFKGTAAFDSTTFHSLGRFDSAIFEYQARFHSAVFESSAGFPSAIFGGVARFSSATLDRALFRGASFRSRAVFDATTFKNDAVFESVTFQSYAGFSSAVFRGNAQFDGAAFRDVAGFGSVTFTRDASFDSAAFGRNAAFDSASFEGAARFHGVTIARDIDFATSVFTEARALGPLACARQVTLSGAVFNSPVTITVAARHLECQRTRWSSTASLQLRHTEADFTHAVFEAPLTISTKSALFLLPNGAEFDKSVLAAGTDSTVRMASLRGVDAAQLVLCDVDLSRCLFAGTVHLDQLRLEGTCTFAQAPPGVHWRHGYPQRFTPRRTLAEEHHWRASLPAANRGWNRSHVGIGSIGPTTLATVYRQLRKSLEDSKNEPDAADFDYGEMEMRRHDLSRPLAERSLLTTYWALSGYGLRATRALVWLLLAMSGTLLTMMLWGLPADDPHPESTGTATGQRVQLTSQTPAPINPSGPLQKRLSSERFEKSLRVVVNSVIFRSSGQGLTTTGTYAEMVSRLTEPILVGLAVLAIRGRIKR